MDRKANSKRRQFEGGKTLTGGFPSSVSLLYKLHKAIRIATSTMDLNKGYLVSTLNEDKSLS